MPELPEVYVRQKYFNDHCLHQKIQNVEIRHQAILYKINETSFKEKLAGKKFKSSFAYGKFLFAEINDHTALAIHFGMTGKLTYLKTNSERLAFDHLVIHFSNGYSLVYTDPRRLGNLSIVENLEDLIQKRKLGPDALHVPYEQFDETLKERKGQIKPLLLDQSFLAGIGNVYADEILFQSKIHPESLVKHLDLNERKQLHKNTIRVLEKMVDLKADRSKLNSKKFLIPGRQVEELCPRNDGGIIEFKTIGGRSSYFCPVCQIKF